MLVTEQQLALKKDVDLFIQINLHCRKRIEHPDKMQAKFFSIETEK
jgi:hypothetical protein